MSTLHQDATETDNESATIKSGGGFIQGYLGTAVSDGKNQVITSAKAAGTANEGERLPELLDRNAENLKEAGVRELEEGEKQALLADANYFSEENLQGVEERGMEAVISDGQGGGSKSLHDGFKYDEKKNCCECPAGKRLEHKYDATLKNGEVKIYQASLGDCRRCGVFPERGKSKKPQGEIKQGKKMLARAGGGPESECGKMRNLLAQRHEDSKYDHSKARSFALQAAVRGESFCRPPSGEFHHGGRRGSHGCAKARSFALRPAAGGKAPAGRQARDFSTGKKRLTQRRGALLCGRLPRQI